MGLLPEPERIYLSIPFELAVFRVNTLAVML
ncbi:MAG: hypothetical protein JWQ08_94 [Deinococcus sp.]|jgi:hypothetical protein|nr:hypothetical protein [Deinococcus sp.]